MFSSGASVAYSFPSGTTIVSGQVPSMAIVRKFGWNDAVGIAETVLNTASLFWQPTTAATLEAISTNANDSAAGTGARTIVVEGLNDRYEATSEIITMNGLAATSATGTRFIRVNRAIVATSGTYAGANLGTITVRMSGAGVNVASIDGATSQGRAQIGSYSVPKGYSAYVQDIHLSAGSVGATKPVDVRMYEFTNINVVTAPFSSKRLVQFYSAVNTVADFDYSQTPIVFSELTDIWFTGQVNAGAGSASTSVGFVLIKN